jgi:hypothetical protein
MQCLAPTRSVQPPKFATKPAQAYLRCLDAARAEVSEEINRAIHDYQALSPEPDG